MSTRNLITPLRRGVVWCALLTAFAASHSSASAQGYAITAITVPNADSVSVSALNANGVVVGYYVTNGLARNRAFRWANGVAVDLGTLGGDQSSAAAVNTLGQVVGEADVVNNTSSHAFLGIGLTLFDLGTLGGDFSSATAISDAGYITGQSDIVLNQVESHAFLTTAGGTMVDVGTLGGTISGGIAVNDAGQVAGDSFTMGDLLTHAFLYSGSLHDLGTLGGTVSSAAALNQSGMVTGDSTILDDAEMHAFLYDGAIHDLGTLGGLFSSGYGINNAGQVMGDSTLANGDNHGFIYRNGALEDLGTLGGGPFSTTWMINNASQIVGVSTNGAGDERAFLWQDGTMSDLNTLIPANSGWVLNTAFFINDNGQIVGIGQHQGVSSYYLLTPQTGQNHPPVANAGPDQTVGATEATALATVDGSGSSDPDGDALSFAWFEGSTPLGTTARITVPLAIGVHTLTLRVTDTHGASAEDSVDVTVADVAPPVVQCPAPITQGVNDQCQATVPDVTTLVVASDNGTPADQLMITQVPAAGTPVVVGDYPIQVTVTDKAGNSTQCSALLQVRDQTPPSFLSLTVDQDTLKPANHQMTTVTVTAVVQDNCDPNPNTQIENVTSSEPVTGPRDNTSPDWIITGPFTVQLRAEVAGKDDPRIYTISVSSTDAAGNTSRSTVTVTVPKNKNGL